MPAITGRRVRLPLSRRWIADLMHACRAIPLVTVERRMDLSATVAARDRVSDPPAWAALFVKAYAVVAARTPTLRQAYLRFPWPHLFEADESVASVAVARQYEGEPAVFFGHFRAPERKPLSHLTGQVREWKTRPVEEVRSFARLIRYSRYPRPVRRLVWWLAMNLSGRHRAKTFGTFGLSTVGSAGAGLLNVIAPTATTLGYGPLAEDGTLDVRLTFDHRVLDGLTAAAALADLEGVLRGEMVRELTAPAVGVEAA
ncbi:MAG TPA: hypothetical protein VM533_20125 [Fimbriiglobus sp.]|nr:hypothetical protein [Fimbriiglobus sp.]